MKKTVEITALTYGGRGLGRIDEKVIFVPFTAPGDVCEVEVTVEKKSFSEGRLLNVVTPSPDRVLKPKCPVFTECGGCHWQHLSYEAQLKWKAQILTETLKRMAGVEIPPVETIASPEEYNYRSSVRLHVKDGKWGFFATGTHDIVDIDDCPLLDERLNDVLRGLRAIELPSFILASLYGVDLMIDLLADKGEEPKETTDEGTVTAVLYVKEKILGFDWNEALEGIGLKGFELRLKDPRKRGQGKSLIRRGELKVGYEVDGIKLYSGVSGFRQANLAQNALLVEKVIEFSRVTEDTEVLDLFSGIGNLTLPLAKRAKSVLGMDVDSDAIKNGIENAELNHVENADFLASEARLGQWMSASKATSRATEEALEKETPCVVVLDPPRTGAKDVIADIASAATKVGRIVYVSCDPMTLARDIKILKEAGYAVDDAACIDMFAETYHIEAVIGLSLI